MGIISFSKIFENQGEIKYKDLKGKRIAVDAMFQLHRMAHPFKTAKAATLTAPDGLATNHINGLLALILNLKKCGAEQVWVFDNHSQNAIKDAENKRRHSNRELAKKKLQNILTTPNQLFSDSDEDDGVAVAATTVTQTAEILATATAIQKNKYERASFNIEPYMIGDLQYMLDCFEVPWIRSPPGFEAEQIAAYMTIQTIDDIKVDAVLTPDPDCLLFGARLMIKNDTTASGKLYKYNLDMLLIANSLQQKDLIKIGVILGCDFAHKTAGIGPKTVLKKFQTTKLTEPQQKAYDYFAKPIDQKVLATIKWKNKLVSKPFQNKIKINKLFDWIVETKGFNKERTESRFAKAKI